MFLEHFEFCSGDGQADFFVVPESSTDSLVDYVALITTAIGGEILQVLHVGDHASATNKDFDNTALNDGYVILATCQSQNALDAVVDDISAALINGNPLNISTYAQPPWTGVYFEIFGTLATT